MSRSLTHGGWNQRSGAPWLLGGQARRRGSRTCGSVGKRAGSCCAGLSAASAGAGPGTAGQAGAPRAPDGQQEGLGSALASPLVPHLPGSEVPLSQQQPWRLDLFAASPGSARRPPDAPGPAPDPLSRQRCRPPTHPSPLPPWSSPLLVGSRRAARWPARPPATRWFWSNCVFIGKMWGENGVGSLGGQPGRGWLPAVCPRGPAGWLGGRPALLSIPACGHSPPSAMSVCPASGSSWAAGTAGPSEDSP